MKGRKGRSGLKGQLVEKSVDAYVLALETINRLSIKYRVESFTHLICNAWELLLKARVLDVQVSRRCPELSCRFESVVMKIMLLS